jgi:hypothetical protein
MYLYSFHPLGSQVCGKEGLRRCVAVNEDRIIADRTR